MAVTGDYHTKWCQKETNTMWYHTYVEYKIWHKPYQQNRNTHRHREQTCGCQGRGGDRQTD